jgi:hypothetical protein
MDEPAKPGPPFWIASTDGQGRAIPPDLVEAARRFWPLAVYVTRREYGDPDCAAEILESAVFAIIRVAHQNGQLRKIENPFTGGLPDGSFTTGSSRMSIPRNCWSTPRNRIKAGSA